MGDSSSESAAPAVTVSYKPDGTRVVTRTVTDSAGKPIFEVTHSHPDAVKHYYESAEDGNVPLYSGKLAFSHNSDRAYSGNVVFTWKPTPRVKMKGARDSTSEEIVEMFDLGNFTSGMWGTAPGLAIDLPGATIPDAPTSTQGLLKPSGDLHVEERVHAQIGDGNSLDEVTFLLPNGWRADDAFNICDSDNVGNSWSGRTIAQGDGWDVVFDVLPSMTLKRWRQLKDVGGYSFTHAGRIRRTDGAIFTSDAACAAIDRIGLGLKLALGRRTSCLLPVGYLGGRPVWTLWGATPVDPLTSSSDWIDSSCSSKQIGELVSRVLDFTTSTSSLQSFKNALAYYVAATVDVDVHLQASLPVSGLQLLTYYHMVTVGPHTPKQWENLIPRERATEWEIRNLLNVMRITVSMPQHFQNLTTVGQQLAANGAHRDALGIVIKMRNVATHPTKKQAGDYSDLQWAEAGMLARYWLCLALLYTVGYQGRVAAVMQSRPRYHGELRKPPWDSTSMKPWNVGDASDGA
ncbi:hypothetical protein [Streptomyces sp. NPDC086010]|uniref:hypothetical protein n=1 Tax=Streptomyces sp. NPDC086010 TaxID=3365745 RepID=UPI0037D6B6D4